MSKEVKKGTVRSRIKTGDMVVFIAGRDYNKFDNTGARKPHRGKVIAVEPRKGRIKVEGAGMVKKHRKADTQRNIDGGIIDMENWVNISNVMLVDPESGEPTRIRYETQDGK